MGERIESLVLKTTDIRTRLNEDFQEAMPLYGSDYSSLGDDDKARLGTLVNNSKSLGALMTQALDESE